MTKVAKIEQLNEIKLTIVSLKAKLKNLENEICHMTDEDDKQFLIENWQKLLRMQQKFRPDVFKQIIVSCFPIKTTICCCMGGSRWNVRLADLLDAWSKGFVLNGKPVIELLLRNNCQPKVSFIDEHCIASKCISYEEASKLREICDKIPTCEKYSRTSVSDLKLSGD